MPMIPDDLPRRILDGSPDAVLITNRDGVICFWNISAERIFGYSEGEALGRSLDLIIPEQLRNRHWTAWDRVMETGKTRYGQGSLLAVPALRKDGQRISIEFSIQLLGSSTIRWVTAIIRDVTEHFRRDKALGAELGYLKDQQPKET